MALWLQVMLNSMLHTLEELFRELTAIGLFFDGLHRFSSVVLESLLSISYAQRRDTKYYFQSLLVHYFPDRKQ